MGRSKAEDRKLSEVKAILQRIQRMAADPTSIGQQSEEEAPVRPAHFFMHRKAALALLGGAALTFILAVGYAFIIVDQKRSRPSTAEAPRASSAVPRADVPAPVPTLQGAVGLMAAGRILAAREQLLRLAPEDTADVAWALARTYDPNFLATIPLADGVPNVAEATRWYRTWYAVAVRQGLVGDSVPLDRIIGSMR